MNKRLTNLPLDKFLAATMAGHRQPDPVPNALAIAALLFVVVLLFTA